MSIQKAALPELATRINAEHAACIAAARDAISRAIEVGRLLSEAKCQVRHGEWSGWVETNCTFGMRESQRYMRAFENRAAIEEQMRHGVSHLDSLRGAMAALEAPSPEAKRDEALTQLWGKVIDEYCIIYRSIEKIGGIKQLTRKWPQRHIEPVAGTIGDIIEELGNLKVQLKALLLERAS